MPEGLENEFWEDFKKFEQEREMVYMTTGERIGYKLGEKSTILRQLTKRLGEVSEKNRASIESLQLEQLDALSEALLDFTSANDLSRWLQENQNT